MQQPLVSVIIPCYNQGRFVHEAVSSVLDQDYRNIEIVIVNDGSNDGETPAILEKISNPAITILHIENQGLPSARNIGIRSSKGKYILPLDADDKIVREYVRSGVEILENHPEIGVVYGRAEYFGDKSGEWQLEKFTIQKLLLYNLIYASAIFRKEDYDKTKGYDPKMKFGWEDWDFWLSMADTGVQFYFLDFVVFKYRVREGSMVKALTKEQEKYLRQVVYCNHFSLYEHLFSDPVMLYYDYNYYKIQYEKLTRHKLVKLIKFINKKFKIK